MTRSTLWAKTICRTTDQGKTRSRSRPIRSPYPKRRHRSTIPLCICSMPQHLPSKTRTPSLARRRHSTFPKTPFTSHHPPRSFSQISRPLIPTTRIAPVLCRKPFPTLRRSTTPTKASESSEALRSTARSRISPLSWTLLTPWLMASP